MPNVPVSLYIHVHVVHGPLSETSPNKGFSRPPSPPSSFLPEGALFHFRMLSINAANMHKYEFLYKPHAKFCHSQLHYHIIEQIFINI